MIEAVGWQYFDEFFRRCSELLSPDGLMLLQAITIDDRHLRGREGRPQLRQHPRLPRRLPALGALIADCLARVTDMRQVWTRRHHRPLPAHPRRLARALPRAPGSGCARAATTSASAASGTFYLSSSEAGFRERRIGDVQALFAKPEWQ